MKVLLDHSVPKKLRRRLPGHLVFTAAQLNVHELVNGALLQFAEQNGFEVLLTADKNIWYQQNNLARKISLVVLSTNHWDSIEPHMERVAVAVSEAKVGGFALIEIPLPRKRRPGGQG